MSDPRYEQYREALQLGHVATQHEQFDAAAAAYRDATRLAPDRALPFVGLGGALARLGRTEEAIAAFGAALERAPDDETALRGRAAAYEATGRRADAADMLDRLAVVLERDGPAGRGLRRGPPCARPGRGTRPAPVRGDAPGTARSRAGRGP